MRLDAGQRQRVIDLVERVPAAALDANVRDLEETLRLARAATRRDLVLWSRCGIARRFGGVRAVPTEQARSMTPSVKLAYVGALVQALARAYGVDCSDDPSPASLAAILRGVNDILWLPLTE